MGTALTYKDTGLTAATTYTYRVLAENRSGKGPWSAAKEAITEDQPSTDVPAKVTGFTAVRDGTTIDLTWTAVSGGDWI